jgi:hypothetical protein
MVILRSRFEKMFVGLLFLYFSTISNFRNLIFLSVLLIYTSHAPFRLILFEDSIKAWELEYFDSFFSLIYSSKTHLGEVDIFL